MKVINLGESSSLLNRYVYEMRNVDIQGDSLRFRRNIERCGQLMAYEISKVLTATPTTCRTPLGESICLLPPNDIVLGTILRAGLPFHEGFISYFDYAENAFVSAYRKYKDRLNFDIHVEYLAAPSLEGKTLILCDPMLATGASMELAYKALLRHGQPKELHIASIIASQPAIEHLESHLEGDAQVWVAALDPGIDEHAYIVPGLGDAGDLAYGSKL